MEVPTRETGRDFLPGHHVSCAALSISMRQVKSLQNSLPAAPASFEAWGRASGQAAPPEDPGSRPAMEEDQELERKAIEELLKEAKRGKTRAETMGPMGPMGWMKCPLARTNK